MTATRTETPDHPFRSFQPGPEPTRARYPDDEGYVERDGVQVFWERYGEGEQGMLLVPSWAPTPARTWKAQIPYLARQFRIVTSDPRGNGRSDRPTDARAYLASELKDDFVAILDATATERTAVVAPGPGTVPALALAAEHPERVTGVVLITPDPWPEARYMTSIGKGELAEYEGWDKFNPAYWSRDWRGFAEWWVGARVCTEPHSTRQIEDAVSWLTETGPDAFTAAVTALGAAERESVLELAGRVRCPVLVIYDDARQIVVSDTWTPLAEATGGHLVRIEGANHGGLWRYPVAFNLALRDFVESLDAG